MATVKFDWSCAPLDGDSRFDLHFGDNVLTRLRFGSAQTVTLEGSGELYLGDVDPAWTRSIFSSERCDLSFRSIEFVPSSAQRETWQAHREVLIDRGRLALAVENLTEMQLIVADLEAIIPTLEKWEQDTSDLKDLAQRLRARLI